MLGIDGCWTKNTWKMENPIQMNDLGGPPLFLETPIWRSDVNKNPYPPLPENQWFEDVISFWGGLFSEASC